MNLRKHLTIAAAATTALLAGTALPASAADTATTFEITAAGGLALTVAASAVLDSEVSGTTGISGSLGAVSVTDDRGGTATWAVSAASTAFVGARPIPSSSTAVSYLGDAVTTGGPGTSTVPAGVATTLTTTAVSVVAATAVSGNNTASWTPVLSVTMPAGALADTYSGTVTTSIL